jgi:glutathione S-transferase
MARLGLEIPLRNIQISSRNRKELLNGGGRKTVPCLRIEDANGNVQWMYESGDIIAYLQRKFGSA